MKRLSYFVFLVPPLVLAAIGHARAATPILTVTQVMHGGQTVTSAADVTLRGLDGHVLQQGIHDGEALPNDVDVEVPAGDTVVITAPNGQDTITLQAGSAATFHYTGTLESVAVGQGRVDVHDSLGFFSHVSSHETVITSPSGNPE